MTGPARQSTDAELDALDRVCERLAGFGLDIHAEWVDGFLAALACGPRPLEPEAWRAVMLGDTFERAFADPQDQAGAMAPLRARLAVLRSQLDGERLDAQPDQAHLVPLMHEFEGDDAPAPGELWAQGFLAAVASWPDDWAPPLDLDDEDRRWFDGALGRVRVLTMAPDELAMFVAATYAGADPPPTRDDLIDEACFAVQDLRLFWADHAPRPETRRVGPQPGRNDPCPCGSGKKYKKCHGAAA